MGRIGIGCHQRFYGFDKTILRYIHQRRRLVLVLGGVERGGEDGGWGRIEEERLVYRVLHVCVWESTETVRRVIRKRRNKSKLTSSPPYRSNGSLRTGLYGGLLPILLTQTHTHTRTVRYTGNKYSFPSHLVSCALDTDARGDELAHPVHVRHGMAAYVVQRGWPLLAHIRSCGECQDGR